MPLPEEELHQKISEYAARAELTAFVVELTTQYGLLAVQEVFSQVLAELAVGLDAWVKLELQTLQGNVLSLFLLWNLRGVDNVNEVTNFQLEHLLAGLAKIYTEGIAKGATPEQLSQSLTSEFTKLLVGLKNLPHSDKNIPYFIIFLQTIHSTIKPDWGLDFRQIYEQFTTKK